MNPIRNSAEAISIQDGCLLAIQNVDIDGEWYTLPGGGQHPGQTLSDALQRECKEEIGTTVRIGKLRLIREYIGKNHEFAEHDGDAHQVEFIFECEVESDYLPHNGHATDMDQTGVAWLRIANLLQFRIYPQILKDILAQEVVEAPVTYLEDVN